MVGKFLELREVSVTRAPSARSFPARLFPMRPKPVSSTSASCRVIGIACSARRMAPSAVTEALASASGILQHVIVRRVCSLQKRAERAESAAEDNGVWGKALRSCAGVRSGRPVTAPEAMAGVGRQTASA